MKQQEKIKKKEKFQDMFSRLFESGTYYTDSVDEEEA